MRCVSFIMINLLGSTNYVMDNSINSRTVKPRPDFQFARNIHIEILRILL